MARSRRTFHSALVLVFGIILIGQVIGILRYKRNLGLSSSYHLRKNEPIADSDPKLDVESESQTENAARPEQAPKVAEVKLPANETSVTPIPELLLKPNHWILRNWSWDAPIVVEKYKLIFFSMPKVGCTVWKQLFRRMEGEEDWRSERVYSVHNPQYNNLTYLGQIYRSPGGNETVHHMLTSDEWTKAIFVRDPKERFLSGYLDKAVGDEGEYIRSQCCSKSELWQAFSDTLNDTIISSEDQCVEKARQSMSNFCLFVKSACPNDQHWRPQHRVMDSDHWKYFETTKSLFVGHMDTSGQDAKRLLQQMGGDVWEKYGANGWGSNGTSSIFTKSTRSSVQHKTGASDKLARYYTSELEADVEELYAGDYGLSLLGLNKSKIHFEASSESTPLL